MELGDFEPANEFEFDLSDVDVAAFESVATEDAANSAQEQQIPPQQQSIKSSEQHSSSPPPPLQLQPSHQEPPPEPQHQQNHHHLHHQQQQPQQQQQQPQQSQPQQEQEQHQHQQQKQQIQTQLQTQLIQQQQQQHNVNQISQVSGAPAGKILLVPINSKPGQQGFKHFLQLPAGTSPIAMGTIPAPGNKKQIIQLAPLSASSLNMGKNSYSYPITTASHQLPGSSQGQKQHQPQQQLYLTMNSASPSKQQTLNLNSVLNKSLCGLQNNATSIPHQFSTGNLNSRNISYNDTLRASTPNSNIANEVPKRKPCNCTKSQCLKLYCDCFANGEFCSGCNCTNCFNSLSKEKERQKAISQCLERNPEAFRPKIGKAVKSSIGEPAPESIERRHTKGCNCKRSGCLKNYCECYEAKILCSNLCKCCGCKNYDESFERKSLMQLANSASENARGILKNLLPTNTNHFNPGKEFNKKCFISDKIIRASLTSLLQSAQQAEKDGTPESDIQNLLQIEMGKCLKTIVDSATESSSPKKR